MILRVYRNSFNSISFPVLLTYRPTTSVNRKQRCHYPVTKHRAINEGKHVDSVGVAGVCSYLYQTITNHLVTYVSRYDAFIRLNECLSPCRYINAANP
jgi:hypothetical protein